MFRHKLFGSFKQIQHLKDIKENLTKINHSNHKPVSLQLLKLGRLVLLKSLHRPLVNSMLPAKSLLWNPKAPPKTCQLKKPLKALRPPTLHWRVGPTRSKLNMLTKRCPNHPTPWRSHREPREKKSPKLRSRVQKPVSDVRKFSSVVNLLKY